MAVTSSTSATSPYGIFNHDIWFVILDQMTSKTDHESFITPIPKVFTTMMAINKSIARITARKITTTPLQFLKTGLQLDQYVGMIQLCQQPVLFKHMTHLNLAFLSPDDTQRGIHALKMVDPSSIHCLEITFKRYWTTVISERSYVKYPIKVPDGCVGISSSNWAPPNLRKAARAIQAGEPLQPRTRIKQRSKLFIYNPEDCDGWQEIVSELGSLKAPMCFIWGLDNTQTAIEIEKQIRLNWRCCYGSGHE